MITSDFLIVQTLTLPTLPTTIVNILSNTQLVDNATLTNAFHRKLSYYSTYEILHLLIAIRITQ